ncbi:MAG: O-succinylhomoserine sulfhydrylase [Alphaproteobacteria bacterium]|nr:O-succinylhomoserine sulfhydrylase [Alphaproteobacteria bacterium]
MSQRVGVSDDFNATPIPQWHQATKAVRGGGHRSPHGETSEAMYLTSGYVYDDAESAEARFKRDEGGFIYSRYGNPTVAMFEQRMALLEGAPAAFATTSGMAAVTASLLCQVSAGDHVVASRALFGSCRYVIENILPRYGVSITLVEGTDLDQWRAAVQPETVCAFIETPSNPTLEIIDVVAVADIVHDVGARLIVDNVFATPILQRPMDIGADIVVYSTTKHIDGQGRCLGGVVLGDEGFCLELLQPFLQHTGPCLSPFNAWVMLKGLETLELRVTRHCENADRIARFLQDLDDIERVLYPNLDSHPQHQLARSQMDAGGTVVTFDLAGGRERAFRFLNALDLVDISNNLGDAKSLITHPATTTHQRLPMAERDHLGISDETLRLSVGLEDPRDIKADILRALEISTHETHPAWHASMSA